MPDSAFDELLNAHGDATMTVRPADTAEWMGSGEVAYLATPRLIALLEAATCAALAGRLVSGLTSVGTRVAVDHIAASPIDAKVHAHAEVIDVVGKRVFFAVSATHTLISGESKRIGVGTVTRAIVDRANFN
ncbi:MAG: thioesterase [Actinomycetota bacterium]|nr:thioesterase [Actinomycetota bacterium]